jgi:DNA-binding protein YbaB
VSVTLDGLRSALEVSIAPEVLSDRGLLEELVAAAITDALSKAAPAGQAAALEILAKFTPPGAPPDP